MAQYVVRRLLVAVPALLGATLLAFIILRIIPGDVAEMILRGEQGEGAAFPTPWNSSARSWDSTGRW